MSQEDNCSGGWWNSIYLMIYYSLGFILSPPSSIIFAAFNLLWWWRGRSNNHTNGTRASSGWLAGWLGQVSRKSFGSRNGLGGTFPWRPSVPCTTAALLLLLLLRVPPYIWPLLPPWTVKVAYGNNIILSRLLHSTHVLYMILVLGPSAINSTIIHSHMRTTTASRPSPKRFSAVNNNNNLDFWSKFALPSWES